MNRSLVKEIMWHPNYGWNPNFSDFDYSSDYADYYYNPVMDVSEMFYIFGRLSDITRFLCVSTGSLRWNDMYR